MTQLATVDATGCGLRLQGDCLIGINEMTDAHYYFLFSNYSELDTKSSPSTADIVDAVTCRCIASDF
jgi:hypothetical protein